MGEVTRGFEKIIIVTFFVTATAYNPYITIKKVVIILITKLGVLKK